MAWPSLFHVWHESKLPFASLTEFIRYNLSFLAAHVIGGLCPVYGSRCRLSPTWCQPPAEKGAGRHRSDSLVNSRPETPSPFLDRRGNVKVFWRDQTLSWRRVAGSVWPSPARAPSWDSIELDKKRWNWDSVITVLVEVRGVGGNYWNARRRFPFNGYATEGEERDFVTFFHRSSHEVSFNNNQNIRLIQVW